MYSVLSRYGGTSHEDMKNMFIIKMVVSIPWERKFFHSLAIKIINRLEVEEEYYALMKNEMEMCN